MALEPPTAGSQISIPTASSAYYPPLRIAEQEEYRVPIYPAHAPPTSSVSMPSVNPSQPLVTGPTLLTPLESHRSNLLRSDTRPRADTVPVTRNESVVVQSQHQQQIPPSTGLVSFYHTLEFPFIT